MLNTLYSQIGAVIWLAACAFAFWKGEQLEKTGATIIAVTWISSIVVQDDTNLVNVQYPLFAIDLVVLGVLVFLAGRSDRSWPVWAAGFQLIVVAVHLVTVFDLRVRMIAYFSAVVLGSYGVLAGLVVGTFYGWQERKALGHE